MVKIGDTVRIKDNLCEELTRLEFEEGCVEMMRELIGRTYDEVFDIWEDEFDDNGQKYATVDLCVEIPLQCLDVL